MKKHHIFGFVSLVFPIFFLYLAINFKDLFLFICFLVTLLITTLIIFPSLFSSRSVVTIKSGSVRSQKTKNKKHFHKYKFYTSLFSPITLFIFVIITSVFIYLIFNKLEPDSHSHSILTSYYRSLIATHNLQITILLFPLIILSLYYLLILKVHVNRLFKQVLLYIPTYILIVLISSMFSLYLAFLLATFHINIYLNGLVAFPSLYGIVTSKDDIFKNITKLNKPPVIYAVSENSNKNLYLNIISSKDQQRGLINQIVEKIPSTLIFLPKGKLHSLFLIERKLFISRLNKEEIEYISPLITKLIVRNYINKRYIKDEPKISLMNRQEYLSYREEQINKQLGEIDDYIETTIDAINFYSNNVSIDNRNISLAESEISRSIVQRDASYEYCINAGYKSYFTGTFYHLYSKEECDSSKNEWDNYIAKVDNNLNQYRNELTYDQNKLDEFSSYKTEWDNFRILVESQKDNTPYELGVFIPKKTIKIALDSIDPSAISDYLSTLTHEYFHYASYVSEERQLLPFFEEGLTEFFSRRTINKSMDIQNNVGYPIITRIIEEMSKKISEKDLEDVYFTKNEEKLEYLLDKTYGKKFYEDSKYYFVALYYIQTVEGLEFANNLMFKIGGDEITEESL